MYDLIIRNGLVIDGSGAQGKVADVAISDGRIAAIGQIEGEATREIDASGLAVAPGFVDVHTHYDAQVFWDPALSPSCFHGVTTVVAGNCGFSIAPLTPATAPYLTRMLARVEGMPVESLREGVPWDWRSFGEFLNRLEGRVGVNIGFMAGHSAIRCAVMGERAVGEPARPEELEAMRQMLDRCLSEGALGFSTTNSNSHNDAEGRPVPSRYATREEFVSLAAVCGRHEGASLEIVPGLPPHTAEQRSLMIDMSAAAKRTLNWNVLAVGDNLALIDDQLLISEEARAAGAEVIALTTAAPMNMIVNLLSGFIFDMLPGWEDLFKLTLKERMAHLSKPEVRRELDRRAQEATGLAHVARWRDLTISASQDASLVGRTVGEIAAERGVEPFDALLDISIADQLKTGFLVAGSGASKAAWKRRGELWKDPRTVIGASDAGAHLDMIDQFAFSSAVLAEGVRERKLLSLEQAVHQLTQVPAELIGLRERGLLRPGWRADVVVFDPATVAAGPVYLREDLPGKQMRLYADAIGVEHVIVNGDQIVEKGRHTGRLPGRVLRSGRDTATRPMPAQAA